MRSTLGQNEGARTPGAPTLRGASFPLAAPRSQERTGVPVYPVGEAPQKKEITMDLIVVLVLIGVILWATGHMTMH